MSAIRTISSVYRRLGTITGANLLYPIIDCCCGVWFLVFFRVPFINIKNNRGLILLSSAIRSLQICFIKLYSATHFLIMFLVLPTFLGNLLWSLYWQSQVLLLRSMKFKHNSSSFSCEWYVTWKKTTKTCVPTVCPFFKSFLYADLEQSEWKAASLFEALCNSDIA